MISRHYRRLHMFIVMFCIGVLFGLDMYIFSHSDDIFYESMSRHKAYILNRNETINLSALPAPEAFSQRFYGHNSIKEYKWYFRPRETKVFSLDYGFLKESSKGCDPNEQHEVVVLVLSVHQMKTQREAIRGSWGSVSKKGTWPGSSQSFSVKVFFILGLDSSGLLNAAVSEEAKRNGDMILAEFEDSYYNLTLKVLMGFKWIKQFCSNTKYVLKADEDTYINIPKLMKVIDSRSWHGLIYGPLFRIASVSREGKHRVSRDAYPLDTYPPHVKGNIYFMARDTAMTILALSEYMPYINIEDVHITGILAKTLNIRHVPLPLSQYHIDVPASPCNLVKGTKIASQKIFGIRFYFIWKIEQNSSLCADSL